MPFSRSSLRRRPLLALIVLIVLLLAGYAAKALDGQSHSSPPRSGSVTAAPRPGSAAGPTAPAGTAANARGLAPLSGLPAQARQTVLLIERGGPFPYRQDGVIYNNLEHQLPSEPRGYYHEYTVVTPGSPDRGARRIITSAGGAFYYTANHYASFVAVDINR
jgi:ribonuclease T1